MFFSFFFHSQDEIIYIHRQWVLESQRKIFPQNLHIQFHGREIHSLCFVSEYTPFEANGKQGLFDKSSWIATGCEDGTVRLTRYANTSYPFISKAINFVMILLVSFLLDNLRLGPRALTRSSCHAYLDC